jgi:hypothetical protein
MELRLAVLGIQVEALNVERAEKTISDLENDISMGSITQKALFAYQKALWFKMKKDFKNSLLLFEVRYIYTKLRKF